MSDVTHADYIDLCRASTPNASWLARPALESGDFSYLKADSRDRPVVAELWRSETTRFGAIQGPDSPAESALADSKSEGAFLPGCCKY